MSAPSSQERGAHVEICNAYRGAHLDSLWEWRNTSFLQSDILIDIDIDIEL